MSDELQQEFDDQLLSAYLDDELTPEERARVEERLAVDPAARQLVEQLRAVSRTLQGLPQESLGEDLRGAVLQRAERAMLAPAQVRLHEPATDGQSPRRFSYGRSPRGWAWAGLAVAAALVIMFIEREGQRDKLPDVAVAPRSEDLAGGSSREVPELRALPMRSTPMAAATGDSADSAARDATMAEMAAPASRPVDTSTPPAAASEPEQPTTEALAASDRLEVGARVHDDSAPAAAAPDDRRAGLAVASPAAERLPGEGLLRTEEDRADTVATAAAPPAADIGREEELDLAAEDELVVVRVNVRPAALRNQEFDRLLSSNSIVFEPPVEDNQTATTSGAAGGEFAMMGRGADKPVGKAENVAADQNVDAVLVEAPVAQIEQCLADIDADKDNYLGVAIDQEPANRAVPLQNVANERNWQRYNRGRVPQQQVQLAPESNVYYDAEQNRAYGLGRNFLPAQQSLAKGVKLSEANGRAMRVQTQQVDTQRAIDQLRSRQLSGGRGGLGVSRGSAAKEPADEAGYRPDADMLQVLFVLTAEPTPSPAAGDRIP